MSFPTLRQSTTSTQTALTDPANLFTFTSAAVAGNLLVITLAGDKNTGTLTVSDNISGTTGWVVETAIPGAGVSLYVARKTAVGGETAVTATTSTASVVGNTGYAEEIVDDGAGAWTVVAKATPAYSDAVVTTAASGTSDTADYDGRALAVGVVDSQNAYTGSFSGYTTVNTPVAPAGAGGGNAGCWVGTANIAAGATTSTTFTVAGGAGDQLTCAIVAVGRVESAPTGGPTSTLVDNFSGATFNAAWSDVYGGASLDTASGRGKVPASHTAGVENFAGIQTGTAWTLDDLFVRVYPQTLSGATADCYTSLAFEHPTIEGTRVVISYHQVEGTLVCSNQVAYDDAGAVSVAFSSSTHAWWRLTKSGANLLFRTSPDGLTWTTQRTITAPTWLASGTGSVLLDASRATGTASDAYFDNVNVTPPVTVATRFYLNNSDAPYTPSAALPFWDAPAAALTPSRLGRVKAGAAVTTTIAETATTSPYYVLLRQWVSAPATAPGSLAGNYQCVIGQLESNAAADMALTAAVWVTVGDSTTIRGTALSAFSLTEFPTTTTALALSDALAGQVDYQAGDRIVVELGYRAANTVATSYSGTVAFGGTAADLVAADTDMTKAAWFDLPLTAATFDANAETRTISDTASAVDTVSYPINVNRALADEARAVEPLILDAYGIVLGPAAVFGQASPQSSFTPTRAVSDDAEATDGVVRATSPNTRELTEAASAVAVDSIPGFVEMERSETSSAGAVDTLRRAVAAARSISDSAGVPTDTVEGTVARIMYETAGATDQGNLVGGDVPVGSDLVVGAGSMERGLTLPRVPADVAAAVDAVAGVGVFARSLTDAAAGVDTVVGAAAHPRALADTVSIDDDVTRVAALPRDRADLAAAVDTVRDVQVALVRILDDALAGVDAVSGRIDRMRSASDEAGAADTLTPSINRGRRIADGAGADDSTTKTFLLARVTADTANAGDALTGRLRTRRALAEAVSMSDGPMVGALAIVGDALVVGAGSIVRTVAYPRVEPDTAKALDTVRRTAVLGRIPADAAVAADTGTGAARFARPVADDDASAVDSLGVTHHLQRRPLDTARAGDLVRRAAVEARQVLDTARSEDGPFVGDATEVGDDLLIGAGTLHRTVGLPRPLVEAALVADTLVRASVRSRAVAETAAAPDIVRGRASIPRALADEAIVEDGPFVGEDGLLGEGLIVGAGSVGRDLRMPRPLAELARVTDALGRASDRPRASAETVGAADTVRARAVLPRTLAETAGALETLAVQVATQRRIPDRAAVVDTLSRTVARSRDLAETAGAADVVARRVASPRPLADEATVEDGPFVGNDAEVGPDLIPGAGSVGRDLVLPRTLLERAAVVDTVSRVVADVRTGAETAPAVDVVASRGSFPRALADTAAATATGLVRQQSTARGAADTAKVADTVQRTRAIGRAVAETASASEPGLVVGPNLVVGPDTLLPAPVGRQVRAPRPITESAAAADVVERAELILARALADLADAGDTVRNTAGNRPWRIGGARRLDDIHARTARVV